MQHLTPMWSMSESSWSHILFEKCPPKNLNDS